VRTMTTSPASTQPKRRRWRSKGQRGIGGTQASHDPFGHGHAGHRRPAHPLDVHVLRGATRNFVPRFAVPRLQEIAVVAHIAHMFARILRGTDAAHQQRAARDRRRRACPSSLDSRSRHSGDRRSPQHVAQLMSRVIPHEHPAPFSRVHAQLRRLRENGTHFFDGDRRQPLDAQPHVMGADDPGDRDEDGEGGRVGGGCGVARGSALS